MSVCCLHELKGPMLRYTCTRLDVLLLYCRRAIAYLLANFQPGQAEPGFSLAIQVGACVALPVSCVGAKIDAVSAAESCLVNDMRASTRQPPEAPPPCGCSCRAAARARGSRTATSGSTTTYYSRSPCGARSATRQVQCRAAAAPGACGAHIIL